MNRVYIHNKNSILLKIIYLLLIPFILFGFYKNGILLYHAKLITILELFKPFLLIFISLTFGIIFSKLFKEKDYSYLFYLNLLVSLVTPYKINILIYILFIVILNIIYKFYKFNIPSFYMILLIIYSLIIKDNIFITPINENNFHYNILNVLFGKNIGGISNTLIFMSFISLFVLSLNKEYKKEIPIISLITYYILITISLFLNKFDITSAYFNSNIIFALVFISPISIFSPYTKGGKYIFGLMLGILTFIFSFIDPSLGIYLSIFILSIIQKLFDKLFIK